MLRRALRAWATLARHMFLLGVTQWRHFVVTFMGWSLVAGRAEALEGPLPASRLTARMGLLVHTVVLGRGSERVLALLGGLHGGSGWEKHSTLDLLSLMRMIFSALGLVILRGCMAKSMSLVPCLVEFGVWQRHI